MTASNCSLLSACLFMVNIAHAISLQQSSLYLANVGESVALPCLCQDNAAVIIYWYKQSLGHKPKRMSRFYKTNNNYNFQNEFENLRFSLDTEKQKHNLKITDLQVSDSATYYCVKDNLHDFEFCEGITVSVKDLGSNISALVHQSVSESIHIQPGGSVTLNCTVHTGTCDAEHCVYWFRDDGESHPGIIHNHGDRNEQCERKPDTQTCTCVYKFQIEHLNRSHAGSYYCVVALRGHVLFGDGITVALEGNPCYPVFMYILSGALAFTTILVGLLAFSAYKMHKGNCSRTDTNVAFSATSNANTEDEEKLHYATVRDYRVNPSRRQCDDSYSECMYSRVKK